jgi:uncharacterized membrane protein YqaE (UPF0057 family)
MIYFLAIVFPPIAVLIKGKPISALFNFFLTLLGYIPGVIHAFFVINAAESEKRHKETLKAMKDN